MHHLSFRKMLFPVVMMLAFLVLAVAPNHATATEPAIDGYSPVSYFTRGVAEPGNSRYQHTHKGSTYYFTSTQQIARFKSNPDKYIPHFGAYCPYSLALGKQLPIDPTNFKIVGDYLLLFHRT